MGGSPSVQPFSPFNPLTPYSTSTVGGSGYFDGSGDYLSTASNAAFAMGSGNFTMEMWVYSGANGTGTRLGGNGAGGSWGANRWVMATSTSTNPNKFTFAVNNATPTDLLVSTSTFNNNQWMHVA
ncbi:MAG: LamG-like jellyroll fold domain-containing protein, partial [bacterium]